MKQRKRSKYGVDITKSGVEKRTYKGFVYDSLTEMKFYRDYVEPKIQSGEIISCEKQVKYELQPSFKHEGKTILAVNYVADFVLSFSNGKEIIYDVKGSPDNIALLKRKLFWFKYPELDYRWICLSTIDGGWVSYETVKQGRKERKKNKLK
ncbi:MAG: hypothetical protein K0S18_634 [Anaerocolumna sp.]|jgi:hypothetical protein|nr:hypothetical protein [Anaerocolumna sp.]